MRFNLSHTVRPRRLNIGDTIGIVAPAGPFDRDSFDKGLETIQNMGFATKVDAHIFSRQGYLAGPDPARAAQFNAMIADKQVQAVMSARGGYGSLRILEQLDYAAIAAQGKVFIGFSDVTALHRAIFLRAGLVTLHGPMVTTLVLSDEDSRISWRRTLIEPVAQPIDLSGARVLGAGCAEGVLTGGNLTTLCHLTGTSIEAGFQGQILLLEDIGEATYRIDRMLTQMKLAGLLDGLAGVVLGSFEDCGSGDEIDALVREIFADQPIPIVSGAPIGHGPSNWTVPLGVVARLDTAKGELKFVEPTFRE